MLGVIFTSLIEMMEQEVGLELTETVLDEANVSSNGSYTSVGYYEPTEIVAIVTKLSLHTGIPIPDLVRKFGHHLFKTLADGHPHAVMGKTSVIQLLSQLDSHIHVEVKKLYPEADLPTFQTLEESPTQIKLLYTSTNRLEPLAEGLILGGAEYFGEKVTIGIEPEPGASSIIEVKKSINVRARCKIPQKRGTQRAKCPEGMRTDTSGKKPHALRGASGRKTSSS